MMSSLRVVAIASVLATTASGCVGVEESDELSETSQEVNLAAWLRQPRAKLAVLLPSSTITQSSATSWTLTKAGAFDDATDSVTWDIAASPNGASTKTITVAGKVYILNVGTTAATIGNVVVKLEAKNPTGNGWTTVSTNIANASLGDAATTAKVIDATDPDADEDPDDNPWVSAQNLSENAASGRLTFTQGASTPYPLSPKKSINPFNVLDLRFTATFDNTVLGLANGRQLRAEIIVTSGNAGTAPRTLANVDIDGSASISADEARVRSKGRRLGNKTLPAPTTSGPSPVTISDTLADIATSGTVTFSNAVFDISGTSGTVRADVDGGTDGGAITNCASLTGSGVALQACSSVEVPAAVDPCAVAGAPGCGWENGEVVTLAQDDWSEDPSGLLSSNYDTVYPSGSVVIGSLARYTAVFTSAGAVLAYIPVVGTAAAFTTSYLDPATTSSGAFGGNVLALELNVSFSAAGLLNGTAGLQLGDLTVCGTGVAGIDGGSVAGALAAANTAISGAASSVSVADAAAVANNINEAFRGGVPSTFAQSSLVNGACP